MGERRGRLSADGWVDAAMDAIAEGGLPALAVEPLAARLGATKGSFYWHFERRETLLAAVLERWEDEGTDAVIRAVQEAEEGLPRLERLLEITSQITRATRIEHALLAANDDVVTDCLERVTVRRIDATARLFRELGFPPAESRRRALLTYASRVGFWQLQRLAPGELPSSPAAVRRLAKTLLDALARR